MSRSKQRRRVAVMKREQQARAWRTYRTGQDRVAELAFILCKELRLYNPPLTPVAEDALDALELLVDPEMANDLGERSPHVYF